jgi:hypothetical protein
MSSQDLRYYAGTILDPLRRHGYLAAVAELEQLIGDLDDPDRADEALKEMIAQSDIFELGDLSISTMSLDDWWHRLGEFREACREEQRRQRPEKAAPAEQGPLAT